MDRSDGDEARRAAGEHRKKVVRRADGWPVNRLAVVERAWSDFSVVILGGGPSLALGDGLVRLKSARTDRAGRPLALIAVNNAYQVAPQADVLYFADGRWYTWHKDKPEFKAFAGLKVTVDAGKGEGDPGEDAYTLQIDGISNYSRDPGKLAHGGNGGYQAINLAALAGARRIILLGYDMKAGKGGRQNWHEGHPIKSPDRWMRSWIPNFRTLAGELKKDGVEVINASEDTALDAFPRQPIAELLPDPA